MSFFFLICICEPRVSIGIHVKCRTEIALEIYTQGVFVCGWSGPISYPIRKKVCSSKHYKNRLSIRIHRLETASWKTFRYWTLFWPISATERSFLCFPVSIPRLKEKTNVSVHPESQRRSQPQSWFCAATESSWFWCEMKWNSEIFTSLRKSKPEFRLYTEDRFFRKRNHLAL